LERYVGAVAGRDGDGVDEMSCWACELAKGERRQHKSKWLFLSPNVGAVVVDLHSRAFDKRLLFVPDYSPGAHVPCGQETSADHESAVVLLDAVAKARLPEYRIVSYDLTNHSYRAHWHAQANLEAR